MRLRNQYFDYLQNQKQSDHRRLHPFTLGIELRGEQNILQD